MATETIKGRFRQKRETPHRGLSRARILGHIETQPILGYQERIDGPVASVALMPHAPAILQLDQGLQLTRTRLARPQILPGHVREVEDRNDAFGRIHFGQSAIRDASQPNRRAGPFGGLVVAKRIDLRENRSNAFEKRLPLTVSIRPKKDGGLRSALGSAQCLAERILKRLD
jgi:hypothetical protein